MLTLGFGGITNHYMLPSGNYCNKINKYGTINNSYLVAMIGNDTKVGIIKGFDSVCEPITGMISSANISDNLDFVIGGYNTNTKAFEDRGLIPPSINKITPIFGLNYKINITDNLNLNNVISYGITTHFISYEF